MIICWLSLLGAVFSRHSTPALIIKSTSARVEPRADQSRCIPMLGGAYNREQPY
ncbi:hypothetical protein KP509_07G003500 [Ceratopteris richardii]|uniref:Uncharacterized protein n=1 Tax=Ceratopteris richardii TaxID=49495 RepID=A0A8T2U848_CERRI|nr:hypothetical protein KP509_07G003500 [Ceratopteris richardii]